MKKPVNMRIEEDIIKIIEKEKGNTFTEKFTNLVTRLDSETSAKQKKIALLDKQISDKEEKLKDLGNAVYEASQILKPYVNVWRY